LSNAPTGFLNNAVAVELNGFRGQLQLRVFPYFYYRGIALIHWLKDVGNFDFENKIKIMSTKYTLLSTALLLIAHFCSKAQQGTVSSGATVSAAEGSISNAIGQVAFLHAAAHNGSINQGLQQPYMIQQVSVKEPNIDIELKIYPNPTTDVIWIEATPGYAALYCKLTDAAGKILVFSKLQTEKTALSMQAYATGTYFLNILHHHSHIQTFKITKTN